MDITFGTSVTYFFKTLHIENDLPIFSLSLVICFLVSVTAQALLVLRVDSPRNFPFLRCLLPQATIYLLQIVVMLLVMTCNAWVIFAVVLGQVSGYAVYNKRVNSMRPIAAEGMCC